MSDEPIIPLNGRRLTVSIATIGGLGVLLVGGVWSLVWSNTQAIHDLKTRQDVQEAVANERWSKIEEALREIREDVKEIKRSR